MIPAPRRTGIALVRRTRVVELLPGESPQALLVGGCGSSSRSFFSSALLEALTSGSPFTAPTADSLDFEANISTEDLW